MASAAFTEWPLSGLGLSYIASEKNHDELSFAVITTSSDSSKSQTAASAASAASTASTASDKTDEQNSDVAIATTNVRGTINLPVINECLLSVASKVNANLTLDVLLVPALQTPSQPGWPQTNQWHTCRFILPPSDFYVVVNHQRHQASTLPKKYCQVQLQFVTLKDQDLQEFNLTEPFCLHGSTDHIVKGNPLKWLKRTYLNLTWMSFPANI